MKAKSLEPYYTLTEIMHSLRVSRTTVYKLIDDQKLHSYKVGKQHRFDPEQFKRDLKLMESK